MTTKSKITVVLACVVVAFATIRCKMYDKKPIVSTDEEIIFKGDTIVIGKDSAKVWTDITPPDTMQIKSMLKNYYLTAFGKSLNVNTYDSINRAIMSPQMYDRMGRWTCENDAVLMILGQDVPETFAETLTVSYADNGWFEVHFFDPNYIKNYGKPYDIRNFLKVKKYNNSEFKIVYIYPFGCDENHVQICTDTLFFESVPTPQIDTTSTAAFAETFYKAYVNMFCTLYGNTETETAMLRRKYFDTEANDKFHEIRNYYKEDGMPDYDIIIDGFTTDRFRAGKIKIENKGNDVFKIGHIEMKIRRNISTGECKVAAFKNFPREMTVDEFIAKRHDMSVN